jgi:hypothetical protein
VYQLHGNNSDIALALLLQVRVNLGGTSGRQGWADIVVPYLTHIVEQQLRPTNIYRCTAPNDGITRSHAGDGASQRVVGAPLAQGLPTFCKTD